MLETATHLVEHILPRVPVRQWVLSFPRPLRLLFAARPQVLTQFLNVLTRALSTAVVKRAGLSRNAGGQIGMARGCQMNEYDFALTADLLAQSHGLVRTRNPVGGCAAGQYLLGVQQQGLVSPSFLSATP